MSTEAVKPLSIDVRPDLRVSALLQLPAHARALFVFAHGAGAGMNHPFMTDLASALAKRDVGTLRYQFPSMERGSRRPDSPTVCHATVRAAVAEARNQAPTLAIVAGGKSFGGRMTSQAHSLRALPDVRGLVFVGFPLHPPKHPGVERAKHLSDVSIPMLFLQGTRDELADLALLEPVVDSLGPRARLKRIDGADHSFHVRARDGRINSEVIAELADVIVGWTMALGHGR